MDSRIPSLVAAAEQGDPLVASALFEALYAQLHRLARRQLARSGKGAKIGVTTLLHEAYLDISRRDSAVFPDRSRFIAYAAKVMRGLIIDDSRSRRAQKRGGAFEIMSLDEQVGGIPADDRELTRVGALIDELATVDASLAELVDLKFFCGFSFAEIASLRGVSERTVQRHWERARIYLHRAMRAGTAPGQ